MKPPCSWEREESMGPTYSTLFWSCTEWANLPDACDFVQQFFFRRSSPELMVKNGLLARVFLTHKDYVAPSIYSTCRLFCVPWAVMVKNGLLARVFLTRKDYVTPSIYSTCRVFCAPWAVMVKNGLLARIFLTRKDYVAPSIYSTFRLLCAPWAVMVKNGLLARIFLTRKDYVTPVMVKNGLLARVFLTRKDYVAPVMVKNGLLARVFLTRKDYVTPSLMVKNGLLARVFLTRKDYVAPARVFLTRKDYVTPRWRKGGTGPCSPLPPPAVGQIVYAVLGGDNAGVLERPTAEANAAFGLDRLLYRLGYDKAEKDPQTFAKEIAASTQISDIFATAGPFYAVYQGKTQRAIYVRNYTDVEAQVHDFMYPKYRKFDSIKEAL
ncbi:hypothetical protein B0H16DRAFT_1470563, partial [Mycena metata]